MKKLTGNQTRALFLEYFKKQGTTACNDQSI